MARIPQTRLGQQVAEPVGTGNFVARAPDVRVPYAAFDAGVGEALEQGGARIAAQAFSQLDEQRRKELAEEERRQREAEVQAKRDAEQARRNNAAASFARYQVSIDEATETLSAQLAERSITREQYAEAHQKALKDAQQAHLEPLDQDMKASLADNVILAEARMRGKVRDAVRKSARDERVAGFNAAVEELSRGALHDPQRAVNQAAALFNTEGRAIYGEEGARKGLQAFKELASATYWTDQLNRAKGSYRHLQAVSNGVDADANLDPQKKVAINGAIAGQLATLEHRAEISAARREREAKGAVEGLASVIMAGRQADSAYLSSVQAKTRGTAYEGAVAALVSEAPQSQGFAAAPVVAQQANLQALLRDMNTKGSTPEREAQYRKLETVHKQTIADIKADPWNAAAERNVIPAAPPLEVTPETIGPALAAREAMLPTLETWTGRKESPLRPAEAEALARTIAAQPVENRTRMLRDIGEQVRDPARLRALAEQMGKGNADVATAAWLAAAGTGTTKERSVAELYLRGAEAIRTKTAKIDERAEVGAKGTIYKALEGAYNTPQATDAAADAALKVYAAMKAEGTDDLQRAIRIATGGIYQGDKWRVSKPYGWTDAEFRDALRAVTPEKVQAAAGGQGLRAGAVPLSVLTVSQQMLNMRLRAAGAPGEYALQFGQNLVTRDDGQPLVIRLD